MILDGLTYKMMPDLKKARINKGTIKKLFNSMQSSINDILLTYLDTVGAVESVKAASDVFTPISGTVVEINEEAANTPSLINSKAESDGMDLHYCFAFVF